MSKGKQVTISLTPDEQREFYRIFGHQQATKSDFADLVKKCALKGAKMHKRLDMSG